MKREADHVKQKRRGQEMVLIRDRLEGKGK